MDSGIGPISPPGIMTLTGGVYVDSVLGVAGTDWPRGTPSKPSNNSADALAIAAARNTKVFYVMGTFDLTASMAGGYKFIGAGVGMGDTITGVATSTLNLMGFSIDKAYLRDLVIADVIHANDGIEAYNCHLLFTIGPVWGNFVNCLVWNGITLMAGRSSRFINCRIDTFSFYVDACAEVDIVDCMGWIGLTNITAGNVFVIGNGLEVDVDGSDTGGNLILYGDITFFGNTGGTVVKDYTNKPKSEVPVNITAILASETNFLNLATAGNHYTIDDLVLKCANPGANTVNVKLYKLVNGAPVNTKTFAITTANFGTYFDINTMFGLKSLAGDNIKITVQATAGGPYAVTGSYAYRSA